MLTFTDVKIKIRTMLRPNGNENIQCHFQALYRFYCDYSIQMDKSASRKFPAVIERKIFSRIFLEF